VNKRILIVGNGNAGRTLAADIRARGNGDLVVGFLDDVVRGDDVLGTLADVDAVIAEQAVDLVAIAMPSAEARVVRQFIASITAPDVELAIVPRTYDIIRRDTVHIDDVTDVDVLDLVGRKPVKHQLDAARDFVRGKTVLVTGAAGSIGSRLVAQLTLLEPAAVVCVDRWENGVFALQLQLAGRDTVQYRIADITNAPLLDRIMADTQPDIVYHAAAYKHVPLMQGNPHEAIRNNLGGTLAVLDAAIAHGVQHVVYVSTDKAVNPVNVMGATKRLGELALEALTRRGTATHFNAVRFGNVIESNGSVMQIFRKQIAQGQPLTVTHPDVTRFFMTIDEASQLIIQTTLLGKDGELFVLDMGEPVRILDLATSLVRATKPDLGIEIIGLRPGEKMYEELSYDADSVARTAHDSIFVTRDTPLADPEATLADLRLLVEQSHDYTLEPSALVERLRGFGLPVQ
jgi:FlaA1/EpsC-like NDP-sugar epimerase